ARGEPARRRLAARVDGRSFASWSSLPLPGLQLLEPRPRLPDFCGVLEERNGLRDGLDGSLPVGLLLERAGAREEAEREARLELERLLAVGERAVEVAARRPEESAVLPGISVRR